MLLSRRAAARLFVAILLLSTFSPASAFADTAFSLQAVRYNLTYVAGQLASFFSDLTDAIASYMPATSLTASAAAPSPIAPPAPAPDFLATTTPEASTPPTTTTAPDAPPTTIIQQPVIERIVEKAVPRNGDSVSPLTLATLLANLRAELLSRINAVASAPIAFSGPAATTPVSVATFAPSQRIDQLTNTSITNPTITGGSISGTSITGTITNVINSALATIDDLTSNTITATNASFTNATTTNLAVTNLTASATSTLSGLKLAATDCSVLGNGGKLTTDAFGAVVCAADEGGAGGTVGGLDTQVQFNDGGAFGGNAGFTYNKTAQRATVTYASTTAITASYASSTAGYFGSLSAGTLSLLAPLSAASGGTGTSTPAAWGNILYWNGTNWQGLATSSLGITSAWGSITGTLSNQTDLQSALDAKLSLSSWYATTTTALAEGNNLYFTTNRVAGVLAGTTTDALAQGSTNKYYDTTLFATDLAATTTSALAEGSNLYYTANRVAGVIAGTTTDALAEGSSRLYFTNARADDRINATSTIGTLTSAPNLTTLATSLTGFLKATAGALSTAAINLASDITGILPVGNGGTGWSSIAAGAIPYGNGSSALATTSAASGGQVLAYLGGVPTWTATTTFSAPLSYAGGAVSLAQASGATNGYLASSDWSLFNTKIASTSLSATYPLAYNSATGVFSTAFSTTTENTFSGTNSFTGNTTLTNASTSLLSVSGASWFTGLAAFGNASSSIFSAGTICLTGDSCRTTWPSSGGVWPWTTASNFGTSTTATTTPTWFQMGLHASSTSQLAVANIWNTLTLKATSSALLATDTNGVVSATTSIGTNLLTGIMTIAQGGTGTSTQVTNGVSYFDGSRITNGTAFTFTGTNLGVGTTTPWGAISISTSNTANPQFVIASSTAVNFIVDKSGNIGVGTTSSVSRFNIQGAAGTSAFAVASSTGAPMLTVNADGSLDAKLKQLTADYAVDSGSASISVGDLVSYINGKATKVTATVVGTRATTSTSSSGAPTAVTAAALDSTHFVTTYSDASGNPYAVVGSVSGTTITYGTPVKLATISALSYFSVAALDSTHFVVAYNNQTNARVDAVVSSVSGTTITKGAPTQISTIAGSYMSVAALSATSFVTAFASSTTHLVAVASTISGTSTISSGSNTVLDSTRSTDVSAAALDSTHFVVSFNDQTNTDGVAIVSSVSGTTITPGTPAVFSSGSVGFTGTAALDSTHFITAYAAPTTNYLTAAAASVSGTTITYGASVTLNAVTSNYISAAAIDSSHVVVSHAVSSAGPYAMVVIVSGTIIASHGPDIALDTSGSGESVAVLDSTHFVTAYMGPTPWYYYAVVAQPLMPNILGMATNAASAGGTVTVASNGIVSGLSGLTAGAQYYYDPASGTTTVPSTYKIGIAISSTQILLNSGDSGGPDQFFGDMIFANNFRITEGWDAPQSMIFKNQLGRQIMEIDENGNLSITSAFSGGISSSTLSNILATSTTADAYDFVGGVMSAIGDRLGFTSASSTTATTSMSTATSTSTTIDSFATRFIHAIFAQISAWFADASNGIGDFFAATVHAHKLCADDICVTRDELAAMVAAASQSGVFPSSNAHEGAPQAPVIELNGSASSTIDIGDTYNDLGARIVAPTSDLNLGLVIVLDGATTTAVSIDTTTPGEHTIIYTVTSPATGLTGSVLRTVIVSPAELSPAPAEDTHPFNAPPSNYNASSTTAVDAAA